MTCLAPLKKLISFRSVRNNTSFGLDIKIVKKISITRYIKSDNTALLAILLFLFVLLNMSNARFSVMPSA